MPVLLKAADEDVGGPRNGFHRQDCLRYSPRPATHLYGRLDAKRSNLQGQLVDHLYRRKVPRRDAEAQRQKSLKITAL